MLSDRVLDGDMEAADNTYDCGALAPRVCRLELKIKAYDSVTDARAWSHKICKQTGLILDTIKRDFGPCPRKLIPTRVIVETLLAGKSKEIAQLRHRIAELERQLHGTSDRGDATQLFGGDTHDEKAIGGETDSITSATDSTFSLCYCLGSCDQATNTLVDDDPGRLQHEIIRKDAKMAAMQNAIDILESDICEPYCVYAYINTTLEKIFAILKHNIQYRSYFESLVSIEAATSEQFKPTTNMDLKGRIVIKLKVLENFCEILSPSSSRPDHANISYFTQRIIKRNISRNLNDKLKTSLDIEDEDENNVERSELIAQIIEGDEMLRTLCQPSSISLSKHYEGSALMDTSPNHLLRIQQMQSCYAELVTRYEELEHEKSTLQSAVDSCSCGDYLNELYDLRNKLKDHSFLQDEKKRLKSKAESFEERNSTLSEELAYCKARLLAETEVNRLNLTKLEHAIDDNLRLETLLEELKDENQKKINVLQRNLEDERYENDNLLAQIDKIKAFYEEKVCETDGDLLESLKSEIVNLKVSLQNKEEECLNLQKQIKSNMNCIKSLKEDVDYWKSSCEQVTNHNMTLETRSNQLKILLDDAEKLQITLKDNLEEKGNTVKHMSSKITENAQEISQLIVELERNIDEKNILAQQNIQLKDMLSRIESENNEIVNILKLNEKDVLKLNTKNLNCSKDCCKTLQEAVKNLYNVYNIICKENRYLRSEHAKIKKINNHPHECYGCPVPTQNEDILMEKKIREQEYVTLLETVKYAQNENKELSKENTNLNQMYEQLLQLQNNYELLKRDHAFNKTVILEKSNDIDCLNKIIETKTKEIKNLNLNLENIKENYEKLLSSQAEETINISKVLNVSKKESSDLLKQIEWYENINNHFTKMKFQQDKTIIEKEAQIENLQAMCEEKDKLINNYANLKDELVVSKNTQFELCKKNDFLMKEVNALSDTKQQYEEEQQSLKREIFLHTNAYEKIKNENIRLKEQLKEISLNSSIQLEDLSLLKMEIEKIKSENAEHVKNASVLNNKVNEYENMILMLSEDVLRRNDKIRLLEQHAAELESEILALHHHLDGALNSGEQLNTLHVTYTQTSINAVQTHCHNEILRLEGDIARLTEESTEYRSKVILLDTKMSIIFRELEQLIHKTKTEPITENERGSVEWICESFKGIALLIEAQQSKNICLEQTLQKLQMASQLLRSKADETINLIDKEKLLIESEAAIKDIQEFTDSSLLHEPVSNLTHEQAEQEIYIKFPPTKIENQCDVERTNYLKNQLIDLKNAYERSTNTITSMRESNTIYIHFQEKCKNEIENIISSIQSQSHTIKLLKLLVQKMQVFRKSLRVKLVHKNLQTDSFHISQLVMQESSTHSLIHKDIIIDNKRIKFNCKEFDQQKNVSSKLNEDIYIRKYNINNEGKMLIEEFVNKDKSLNDVNKISFAVSARESMQSLTDDYKLSMSKFNGDNIPLSQKSSQIDMSQVRFFTSEHFENYLYEIKYPDKRSQSEEDLKINKESIEKIYEREISKKIGISLKDTNILSDSIDAIDANKVQIENEDYSNFFHIFENDEEIENNTRSILDVEGTKAYDKLNNGDYINHGDKESRHRNEELFDDDTPTHDHHTGNEQEPCRSRSVVQCVMFCPDPSQIHSLNNEMPYLPIKSRTFDAKTDAAAAIVAMETIDEEKRKLSPEKPYLSERDVSRRMGALHMQYERQMRRVAVEHEEGVKSLQRLHEQTVNELTRVHEGEVAALRNRADTLATENARMLATLPPLRDCDMHCHLLHVPVPHPTAETSDKWRMTERSKKCVRELGLSQTAVQTLELRPHSRRSARQHRRSTTPASTAPTCHHSRGHGRDTCPCHLPSNV